jgi:endo-beta-N-acetylglucosaminidase D|tara:strand:+ start:1942 stop:2184 length:243 start_codon:yes stop_codon:yes gene_type:complete
MDSSNETILLKEQISQLESDVKFYKSILEMRNSCIFNLHEKTKKGERVWIDIINAETKELLELDMDDEIKEWLKPVRCEK